MSGLNDRIFRAFGISDSNRVIGPADWIAPTEQELKNTDDVCKCSGSTNLTFQDFGLPAPAGEDSFDAVRGALYKLLRMLISGSVTGKGAIKGFLLQDCCLDGTLEFGQFDNYWYPGRAPTSEIKIERCYTSKPGTKIKCILWDATKPEVVDSPVEVVVRPKWVWLPYFLSQYLWVRLVNLKRRLTGQKLIATE